MYKYKLFTILLCCLIGKLIFCSEKNNTSWIEKLKKGITVFTVGKELSQMNETIIEPIKKMNEDLFTQYFFYGFFNKITKEDIELYENRHNFISKGSFYEGSFLKMVGERKALSNINTSLKKAEFFLKYPKLFAISFNKFLQGFLGREETINQNLIGKRIGYPIFMDYIKVISEKNKYKLLLYSGSLLSGIFYSGKIRKILFRLVFAGAGIDVLYNMYSFSKKNKGSLMSETEALFKRNNRGNEYISSHIMNIIQKLLKLDKNKMKLAYMQLYNLNHFINHPEDFMIESNLIKEQDKIGSDDKKFSVTIKEGTILKYIPEYQDVLKSLIEDINNFFDNPYELGKKVNEILLKHTQPGSLPFIFNKKKER